MAKLPNRILHERICTSETLSALSADEERFFYHLMVQCDDYGRLDGRPSIIRARCFPLQIETITEVTVAGWLNSLVSAGLIRPYVVDDRKYLHMVTWDRYQQTRAKASKYPQPPAPGVNGERSISSDITCKHMSPYPVSGIRESNTISGTGGVGENAPHQAPAASAAVAASPKPARKTKPKNDDGDEKRQRVAAVVDAIKELDATCMVQVTGVDAKAINEASAIPPDRIARAYVAAAHGDWDDWIQSNLALRFVIPRIAGWEAKERTKGAVPKNGQTAVSATTENLESIKRRYGVTPAKEQEMHDLAAAARQKIAEHKAAVAGVQNGTG